MNVFSVLRWMLVLVAAAVVTACAGGVYVWSRWDGLIRGQLAQVFDRQAPDLLLHVDEIHLHGTSSLQLQGVEIRDRASSELLLRIGRMNATVDEAQLVERQAMLIRRLELQDVELLLRRTTSGRWNWQDYEFHRDETAIFIPPVVTVADLRARVVLEHGEHVEPAELQLRVPEFQAVPGSGTLYDFLGDLVLPGAGTLSLRGGCNLKNRTWSIAGRVRDVTADQSLIDLARSTTPQFTRKLGEIEEALTRVLPKPPAEQVQTLPNASGTLSLGTGHAAPRFVGLLDVDFHAQRKADAEVPDLQLKVDIRNGNLSCAALPFRFNGIEATLFFDNRNVIARLKSARDGETLVSGHFQMQLGENAEAPEASVHVENFPITMQLKPLLPPKTQRFLDHFQPGGRITGDARLRRYPSGKWLPTSVTGVSRDGSMQFHRFRQTVTAITAELKQRPLDSTATSMADVVFDVNATGKVGTEPVTAVGWLRNPGAEMELRFDVQTDNLPLDTRFRDALDEQGRKVIESLNLTGFARADLACYRAPGLDQPTDIVLKGNVRDSRLRFRGFPYDIEKLSGEVEFQSKQKTWTFTNLQGCHGEGEITGSGKFRGLPAPGVLDLTVTARGAALDADLFNSLNPASRSIWTVVNPEGRVNLTTAISWTALPGHKPIVRLQDAQVYDAVICPRPFPYRMKIQTATLSFDPNDPRAAGRQHCEIHSLRAEHEGSPITAGGWAEVGADGEWQVHLNNVNAIDLRPDDQLRAALPGSWRETLSRLAPEGTISLESSEMDFRGMADNSVAPTAAWRMNCRLKNCRISAGLDLSGISGLVKANGSWDGQQLINEGDLRLDRTEVLGMNIGGIRGPWLMTDDELVLGNRDVILGRVKPAEIPTTQRIQAQAFGGVLEMDGLVDLTAGSSYRFFAELKNALLEDYARQHAPEQSSLQGVVNSWIFVTGDGNTARNLKGKGQVQIHPAALYEVPVVLELLSAMSRLNFTVSNRTAFNYALVSFDIHDEAFWFDPIDLIGDALSLRGRGRIGFDSDVVMDFYSRPAQSRSPQNLIGNMLMSSATQWVTVQVRGTTNRPQTTVSTRPQMDENLRQLLSTFEPRPNAPIPGLVIPRAFGLPFGQQGLRLR